MYRIIVKEVDRFHSKIKDKNYISEYLIYVTVNEKNIASTLAIGDDKKVDVIFNYLNTYFESTQINNWCNFIEETPLLKKIKK